MRLSETVCCAYITWADVQKVGADVHDFFFFFLRCGLVIYALKGGCVLEANLPNNTRLKSFVLCWSQLAW